MHRSIKITGYSLIVAMMATSATGLIAAEPIQGRAALVAPEMLDLSIDAGRVSMDAHGVELASVLHAMAKAGNFELDLRGKFAARVSKSFTNLPFHIAMLRLLGKTSYVIEYATKRPHASFQRVNRVTVMERTTRVAGRPISRERKAVKAGLPSAGRKSYVRRQRIDAPHFISAAKKPSP